MSIIKRESEYRKKGGRSGGVVIGDTR